MSQTIYRCVKCGYEVKVNYLASGAKCPLCHGTLVASGVSK